MGDNIAESEGRERERERKREKGRGERERERSYSEAVAEAIVGCVLDEGGGVRQGEDALAVHITGRGSVDGGIVGSQLEGVAFGRIAAIGIALAQTSVREAWAIP